MDQFGEFEPSNAASGEVLGRLDDEHPRWSGVVHLRKEATPTQDDPAGGYRGELMAKALSKEESGLTRLRQLRTWGATAGKSFPWRESEDAWLVFVAEMLLRRTRAPQVAALLPNVLTEFPDPAALAEAGPSHVDEVFRSAGLTGRIRQLQEAAQEMRNRHGGAVPVDNDDLMALTGVGPYVASIVSSRLSGSEVILVDTNSVRVAIRVLGVEPTTKDFRRERQVVEAVGRLLGGPVPAGDWFNVIDLAHMVCTPKEPDCEICPLAFDCQFFASTGS